MQHREGTYPSADGLTLHYRAWHPDGVPRAVVVIVHGIGEHSGRYPYLVNALIARNHAIYAFDHRGHGRSPGPRGHVNSWDDYRQDVHTFLSLTRANEAGRSLFLYGHSMGALITLDYVMHDPGGLKGAIISAVPLRPLGVAKPHLIALARLLSGIWPAFTLPGSLDATVISRDPEVVRAYQTDPLVHARATARWGAGGLARARWLNAHAEEVRLPILMIHGAADRIASEEDARAFFKRIPLTDKRFRAYPGGYHEPHNDVNREEVLRDVVEWIEKHL